MQIGGVVIDDQVPGSSSELLRRLEPWRGSLELDGLFVLELWQDGYRHQVTAPNVGQPDADVAAGLWGALHELAPRAWPIPPAPEP